MTLYIGSEVENCPPPYAKPANKTFYRLMDTGIVFRSQVILGYGDPKDCEAHALSLTMSINGAKRVMKMFRRKYRNAGIAKIELNKDCGLVHQDKPEHANWWHPLEFDPVSVATLIV